MIMDSGFDDTARKLVWNPEKVCRRFLNLAEMPKINLGLNDADRHFANAKNGLEIQLPSFQ